MINILRRNQTVANEEHVIGQPIIQLFEQQVLNNPEKIAVRYMEEELTYGQLNEQANYLGGKLRDAGIKPNEVVALLLKQDLEMVIGIMGVLKAGAAYLPISLETPINRIKYIVEDSQAKMLITNETNPDIKTNLTVSFMEIHQEQRSTDNLPLINEITDLIYVMYTSGTTGNPKGVMIENRNLANTINWRIQTGNVTNKSIFLQKSAYVFDVSVGEIFSALVSGGQLNLLSDKQTNDFEELVKVIFVNKVTHMSVVSTLFVELLEYIRETDSAWKLDSLQLIYLGGDSVTLSLLAKYREVIQSDPNCHKLINEYGPTECTIAATSFQLKDFSGTTMTIGKPISNTTIYIINEAGEQCGAGEIGELCIGGKGVSRGYLNQPELTKEKFISNPFSDTETIYRSGDLAKFAEDGTLIFLGRMDDQVKIRGYRIELDEIKDALCELAEIDGAVVSIWEQEESQHLCGYVVFAKGKQLTAQEINEQLKKRLSHYMIPTFIIPIDKIPLTMNGKLDKRSLPKPEMDRSKEIVAAVTKEQEVTIRVFQEILGIKLVSTKDNFFELGGDSIKAIRMISRFRNYDYTIDLPTIMESRYVETISEKLLKVTSATDSFEEVTGNVKLTPIQHLFFRSQLKEPQHFNQSFLLESQERLEISSLKKAFSKLIEHHDMLRAVYQKETQTILPINNAEVVSIQTFSLPEAETEQDIRKQIEEISNSHQRTLDLASGPLVKALCFSTKEKDYLLVIIHHLVVDGISWRIIVEDLNTCYLAANTNQEMCLPAKTDSFQKWGHLLEQYGDSYRVQQELPHWEETVKPIEDSRISDLDPAVTQSAMKLQTLNVDADLTNKLLYKAGKSYNLEINDVLLTALFRTLTKLTGMSTVSVQLEGHGRELIDQGESIDRTVGWFTIMYPVTVTNMGKSLEDDIKNTKETLRRIPRHGISYGLLAEQYTDLAKTQAEVTFNYLGVFNEESESELLRIKTVEFGNQVSASNRFGTKINMDSSVSNGELNLAISYDTAYFSETVITNLKETYYDELTQVVAQCIQTQGVDYSASDFGELQWSQAEFSQVMQEITDKNDVIQKIFPLTTMQEGMLYHKLLDEASTSYVVQNKFLVEGELDWQYISDSLDILAKKHQILRAMIKYKGVKEPRLLILERKKVSYELVDLTQQSDSARQITHLQEADLRQGFDLETDPLFRITVIKTASDEHHLLMTFHHIILDGWCLGPLLNDLNAFYTQLSRGETKQTLIEDLPADTTYEAYVKQMSLRDKRAGLAYWEGLLSGYSASAQILSEGATATAEEEVALIHYSFTEEDYSKLKQFSQKNDQTINSVIETAWGAVLAAYNNTDDVVFGKVVSGRTVAVKNIENALGLFINTIPVRMAFEPTQLFSEVVQQIQKQSFESEKYDDCSLADIQKVNSLGQELFQSIIVFENDYQPEKKSLLSFKAETIREQTNYPLTISVVQGNLLNLRISYDTQLYTEQKIQRVLAHFKNTLINLLDQPSSTMADIELMDQVEKELTLQTFNSSDSKIEPKTLIEVFNEQVKATPNHLAVRVEEETLTYLELNNKANALGQKLRERGIGPESIVAVLANRSLEMIVAMYGVLKAGGAYLPIDPSNPLERIDYTLKDSQAALLLVDKDNQSFVNELTIDKMPLMIREEQSDNLSEINQLKDLAYVIYTSGTTGMPKGVMVENRQLINSLQWHIRDAAIDATSVVLQKSSVAFDVSVAEIFSCGLTGACLQLLSAVENETFHLLAKVIETNKVTHIFMVSTLFTVFLDYLDEVNQKSALASLSHVYLGGDKMTADMIHKLNTSYSDYRFTISNAYGPTECTIAATSHTLQSFNEGALIPIGKPVANTSLYVMNQGKLCGIGVSGELFIGGAGVSRGYLNNPELTEKIFIKNPYRPGEKMYRTGDLVRWLGDGTLDILGRIDEQVKIRGFRVELGEIKARLIEQPNVIDAAVVLQEVNGSHLISAFVVADSLASHKMKETLKKKLPVYMIPDFIQLIAEIPTTRNGKLDKTKLPVPEIQHQQTLILPRTPIEQTLYEIFKEILHVSSISIYDRFFELGGHSLKAIRLAGLIEKDLQAQLSISDILDAQTIERLAEIVQAKQKAYSTYQKLEKTTYSEMSSVQRRLYALNQLEPESILYNVPVIMKVAGKLDAQRLEKAMAKLAERHEPLRTVFAFEANHFTQTVLESVPVTVAVEQLSFEETTKKINDFIQPFDLTGPLFRVKLFQLPDNTSILGLDFHHLIFDGGSLPPLMQDLASFYGNQELPALAYHYKDYCAFANQQDLKEQEQFWLKEFSQGIERINLPTDFPRPAIQSFKGQTVSGKLNSNTKEKIQWLAKQANLTEYSILLSAFNLQLSRYCQTEEVVVGVPVSGRTHPDVQDMIGMFVNTLVLKNQVNEDHSFEQLVKDVQTRSLASFDHQDYPYEALVHQLEPERDQSRNPLFDVMFAFEKETDQHVYLDEFQLEELSVNGGISKFDLTLNIHERSNSYDMFWEYNTDLFSEETIQNMMASFTHLLIGAIGNNHSSMKQLPSISADKQADIIQKLSGPRPPLPNQSLMALFEKISLPNAKNKAISYGQIRMTYAEINQSANQLAHQLKALGVSYKAHVGIEGNKNIETIIGILAILKIGAAYVPLDPKNPLSRQEHIIKDSQIKLILTTESQSELSQLAKVLVIDLTSVAGYSKANLPIVAMPDDTAYIIYTSGTTGLPKGVMVTHTNIIRLVRQTNFINNKEIKILQTGSLAFDASTFELWGPLLNGGSITMIDQTSLFDPNLLSEAIKVNQIDAMFMTTALFNQLISDDVAVFDGLGTLIVGGEKLFAYHVNLLRQHNADIQIINAYGPTETTTFALTHTFGSVISDPIPIGLPIANTTAYVVYQGNICGIGMPGELYIGGAGVSKGYLNQEGLTKEKFVTDAHFAPVGERLYRTGDLVKVNQAGSIDYLGRMDEQVKIRGYRIELSDITKHLNQLPNVRDAVTIVTEESGTKELASYLVTTNEINKETILSQLEEQLPEYMIPKQLMFLKELPKTKNGKVAIKDLPKIDLTRAKGSTPPRNQREKELVEIYKEVLSLTEVGIDEGFFELGGDSIKAIRVVSKLREKEYQVSTKTIMQLKTIRRISQAIKETGSSDMSKQKVVGKAKLTPIQAEFFSEALSTPSHFNQSLLLETEGDFEEKALRTSLDYLVAYHDNLRAVFDQKSFSIPATNQEPADYQQLILQTTNELEELQLIGNNLQGQFDLAVGPLFKAIHFKGQTKDYLLLIAHHLVVDGVSWRILVEDFIRCYKQVKNNETLNLPAKTDSYLSWSEALEDYSKKVITEREKNYWETIEAQQTEPLLVHSGNPDSLPLRTIELSLSQEMTGKLLKEACQAYHTKASDLLLAAYVQTIQQQFSTEKVTIAIEGHGREQISPEIITDRTVGWFTSIYPVAFDLSSGIGQTIKEVKETLRRVPNNGIGYGVLKAYRQLFKKVPEFTFNYLGEIGAEVSSDDAITLTNQVSFEEIDRLNKFGSPVTLNALVTTNTLEIALNFDPDYLPNLSQQEAFASTFEQRLTQIIEHCLGVSQTEQTVSDFGELVWEEQEFKDMLRQTQTAIETIERIIPMTAMQQGMLYHKAVDSESTSYVIQSQFSIQTVDFEAKYLNQAFQLMAEKYSILRANVAYKRVKEPRLIVQKEKKIEFEVIIASLDEPLVLYEETVKADVLRGFDLEKDSLLRAKVIVLPTEVRLVLTFHHIILDGWCVSILINELTHFYTELAKGSSYHALQTALEIDESFEQHVRKLAQEDPTEGLSYWQELVSTYESTAEIATDYQEDKDQVPVILKEEKYLSAELSTAIKVTAQKLGVTINTMIETAWGLLLQKYNYTNDVIFGKVVSGRDAEIDGIENSLGLYINTILLRVTNSGQSIQQLIENVQEQALASSKFDQSSLADSQSESRSSGELIQTLVVFENYQRQETKNSQPVIDLEMINAREETNYAITLSAQYTDTLSFKLMYDRNKYQPRTIQRVLKRLENLMGVMAETPETFVDELELFDDVDQQLLETACNQGAIAYPDKQTIIELFEEQVRLFPDKIAVTFKEQDLTYHQLNQQANHVARELSEAGVEKEQPIGLLVSKKLEVIVGLFGILKANAVYVPLDPKNPTERNHYILTDSGCQIVLTADQETCDFLGDKQQLSVKIQGSQFEEVFVPQARTTHESLAYIIYTSGTSGKPKGVMIEQRNVVSLVKNNTYADLDGARILQGGSLAFDASTFELFGALLNGGSLFLAEEEELSNPELFKRSLEKNQISCLFITTALFNQLISADKEIFDSLETLLVGGEKASEKHFRTLVTHNGALKVSNIYGPTESTTFALVYPVKSQIPLTLPIGKAIANKSAYVLTGQVKCGVDIPGELCLGGDGTARGYLNQPELTAEKFVRLPTLNEDRLYRTGDLVKMNEEGEIVFIGRIDHQVKIRGFRIELDEITNQIRSIPGVLDAVVVIKEFKNEQVICGYFTTENDQVTLSTAHSVLEQKLPDYMIPSYLQVLPELPLTKNGKIDLSALPALEAISSAKYVEPTTENEQVLVTIFQKVLEVEQIGIDDNFFELGGHSLKIMSVVNLLEKEKNLTLSFRSVIEGKTVRKIAQHLELEAKEYVPMEMDDEEVF